MKPDQNQSSPPSSYDDPSIYDILMTPGSESEMDVLERIAKQFGSADALSLPWLEPACGTGRLLRILEERGRSALGYDLSSAMIAYAAAQLNEGADNGPVQAVVADMVTGPQGTHDGSFGFAFNPWNTIRHLTDDDAILAHLDVTARSLMPGGIYVVGLSLTDPHGAVHEEDVWTATRGQCQVTQVVNYLPPDADKRIEQVLSHLTTTTQDGETHHDTIDQLRTYTPEEWDAVLEQSAMTRTASLDVRGELRGAKDLPYQLEVLTPRD